MSPSQELTLPQNNLPKELLKEPIRASLLIPCRVAYPLRLNTLETSLSEFYETLAYNLGQVEKCYQKDEDLIEEVKGGDYVRED